MIEAEGLIRRYGPFTAVHGVSFSVAEGEIVGILGPNGAGKTTTLRMITGFLPPSSGRITVAGHDLLTEPTTARRQIGYLPENVALYPEMRVREYLKYRAQLEGMKGADARGAIDNAIDRCLLADVEWQIISTLSKGFRQRVGLAAAILHRPSVLVLDEPTVGLDPKQIIAIRELIRELGEKRTLMLSTHILPEVEQLCDRVFIIDRGRLLAEGTPEELRRKAKGNVVLHLTLDAAPDDTASVLGAMDGVIATRTESTENGEARFAIECELDRDLRAAVFHRAVESGWTLLGLKEEKASLEDVFVDLTQLDRPPEDDDDSRDDDSHDDDSRDDDSRDDDSRDDDSSEDHKESGS